MNKTLRKSAVIVTTAGATVLAGLSGAGIAQARPDDHSGVDRYCTAEQLNVSMTELDHAMGKTGGRLVFTAERGESCLLSGAPALGFVDDDGDPLPVSARAAAREGVTVRVTEEQSAVASFSFPRVDMTTGKQLHGPVPSAVEVSVPAPAESSAVLVPWSSGAEVSGPVHVTPVTSC
ncbi:hypothetical protein FHX42_002361 [Saccharopolyspora lacisalsi]|uniref:DUF4232 domain-containing protein n=1 Tax=Halosaccharopolyspora lacisalsi TaxID=1000566 RepID=A0A839DU44_9PSEU|nr:DUF4232 domain-containing protein [Halosaccharopolyspora lacisalsi]MBA8825014.1 hypothetical protein [Halosaccharopolyspora lacisalsi]